jgi:hypothetical protein
VIPKPWESKYWWNKFWSFFTKSYSHDSRRRE